MQSQQLLVSITNKLFIATTCRDEKDESSKNFAASAQMF
jgi:hypothetical protein